MQERRKGKHAVRCYSQLLLVQCTSSLWLNDELVYIYFYMKTLGHQFLSRFYNLVHLQGITQSF